MTLELFKTCMADYRRHLTPSLVKTTLESYMLNISTFERYAKSKGETITTSLIAGWITWLLVDEKLKPSTVSTYRKHLKSFFTYCKIRGTIETNPVDLELLPKIPPSPKTVKELFTPDEYKILLADMRARGDVDWHDATVVGYNTSLRLSDVAGLRWDELDWAQESLEKIPRKTKRFGTMVRVPMSSQLFEVLKRRKENPDDRFLNSEYVFPAFRLSYETQGHSGLKDGFIYRTERAKITPRGFHCLRHTFVSKLANDDVNYGTISSMTGQSLAQIASYHHVSIDAQRRAIGKIL